MFNVCLGSLGAALEKSPFDLCARSIFALVSILGWGLLWNRREPVQTLAYSYLQGTVLVSILLLLGTLTLGPSSILGIGLLGFVAALILSPRIFKQPRAWPPRRLLVGMGLVYLASLPFLLQLLRPFPFSDSTAVWAYHGKVLTCEPLLHSHLFGEKIWAGAHPEYPLFFPLMEAYFFALTNSFRDDWSKLWEVAAFLALLSVVLRETYSLSESAVLATVTAGALLTLMSNEGWDGKVEFAVFVFTALCAVAFLKQDWKRMPLFLFGLAFTKNEGLVSALAAWVIFAPFMTRSREGRRAMAFSAILIAVWVAIQSRFPSNNVQYPSELLSLASWKQRLSNYGIILLAMRYHLQHWQWLNLFVLAPCVVFIGGVLRGRKGREGWALFLWPVSMIGVFSIIFVISPWGPRIVAGSFDRLLFPLSALMILSLFFVLNRAGGRSFVRWAGFAILLFLCIRVKVTSEWEDVLRFTNYTSQSDWQTALRLDRELPLGGSGAVLNEPMYYTMNYLLYPRLFYSADPQVIGGTYRPWNWWTEPAEVPKDPRYQFILDARQKYARVHS